MCVETPLSWTLRAVETSISRPRGLPCTPPQEARLQRVVRASLRVDRAVRVAAEEQHVAELPRTAQEAHVAVVEEVPLARGVHLAREQGELSDHRKSLESMKDVAAICANASKRLVEGVAAARGSGEEGLNHCDVHFTEAPWEANR